MISAPELRREKLRRLRDEAFDLLIVGGGINGAGIAREAALRGMRTALVDKGDFASGTSSRSSKLIHGGFRYLETGDFALVLEASRERDLLRKKLAPHLVHPLRFFFPAYRGGPVGRLKLRAGLTLYDLLAAFRNIERHRMLSAAAARDLEPALLTEGLRGAALYHDCWTDDSRLVLDTVIGAEQAGAVCLNYVAVEAFEKVDGRLRGARLRDLEGEGGGVSVASRAIVNAGGPWLDRLRALDDPAAEPVLRPTKGVHLVVERDRLGNRNAIVLTAVRDARILFVIPWEDHTLVGTTDTDYAGSPDEVAADSSDVDYLLETANHYFPRADLRERDVLATFAGLRPLIGSEPGEAPSEVSREESLFESASGLISLGGGKLTTYRRVAVKVVDRVARALRARFGAAFAEHSGTDLLPLPGAEPAGPESGGTLAARLYARYGTRAREVVDSAGRRPELAEPLVDGLPYVRAEAVLAARSEMAVRVEDVLRRRMPIALERGDGGGEAAETVAALMAEELGWSEDQKEAKVREFRGDAAHDPAWRRRA